MSIARGPGGRFTSVGASHALGFAVGNEEFLNSAESKAGRYFRSIEHGTHGFVGRKLTGLWGAGTRGEPTGALGPPNAERSGEQFFPIRWTPDPRLATAKTALAYLEKHGFARQLRGVVKHEIAPMNAYGKAVESFNPVERELAAIEQAFKDSGLEMAMQSSGLRQRGSSRSYGPVGARFTTRLRGAGFIHAQALSTRSRSLVNIDRQFQSNLIQANRLLAEAFASEVALAIKESLKRPLTSKGWLEEATLDPRNRFPT